MKLSELYQYIPPYEDVQLKIMRDDGSIDAVTNITSLEYIDNGIKDYEIQQIRVIFDVDFGGAYLAIVLKDAKLEKEV